MIVDLTIAQSVSHAVCLNLLSCNRMCKAKRLCGLLTICIGTSIILSMKLHPGDAITVHSSVPWCLVVRLWKVVWNKIQKCNGDGISLRIKHWVWNWIRPCNFTVHIMKSRTTQTWRGPPQFINIWQSFVYSTTERCKYPTIICARVICRNNIAIECTGFDLI